MATDMGIRRGPLSGFPSGTFHTYLGQKILKPDVPTQLSQSLKMPILVRS